MARILVIDDDSEHRTYVRMILESEGHSVREAGDGAQGLKQFHQERPDLVITDIIMPEKDGLETIRELSRESPRVTILAMGDALPQMPDPGYLKMARTFGAAATLPKPFTPGDLVAVVRQALQARLG